MNQPKFTVRLNAVLGLMGALYLLPSTAYAAGFAILEQDVRYLGNAFAGAAARADSAATVFFNPAGMTHFKGTVFQSGGTIIVPSAEFKDGGSRLIAPLGGRAIPGGNGGDAGVLAGVPSGYLIHSFNDRWKAGIGFTAPYGLLNKYEDDWKGRYEAIDSSLMTLDFNPSVAFKVTDWFSVGAGFSVQYAEVLLSNAIDFSAVCLGTPATRRGCGRLGLATPGNPATDGLVKLTGDDWSYGWNVGVLFEPLPTTRIGLHYRSGMFHSIKGDANFTAPSAFIAATRGTVFQDTGANAKLNLPDTATIAFYHEFANHLALMADVSWTNWSNFQELVVNFDNPNQPRSVVDEKWEDSYRYTIGANYSPAGPFTYRVGFAYDETPVQSPELRTARIPDEDRYWLAFGLGYQFSKAIALDFSYAHIFIDEAKINRTDSTGHILTGSYDSSADIVGLQLMWQVR